jgi:tartrate-resistant acid phosphatase type 5
MMLHLIFLCLSFSLCSSSNFLSVGDWGSAALGGYHLRNARDTASAMKTYIAKTTEVGQDPPLFVLNTGDNFYYCGIQNTSDPQINEDYTALFGGLGLTWYHSLGNHDYGFSPEAQLELNETIPGWIMDARYYHRRMVIEDGVVVNIIVLDTNPCVRDYRETDRRHWDPCGTQYPDCSPIAEPCRFHENILSQDCDAQLVWVKSVLANISNTSSSSKEWVFVVGHHKAEEIDVADFQTTFLNDPRIHLYLNGHTHNLEHYEINGQAKYMTTGAGGMVIIGDDERLLDDHRRSRYNQKNIRSLWSKVVTGFTSHTFMNHGEVLRTEFWDAKKNDSIYSFDVHI